jgi:hypothetical protein
MIEMTTSNSMSVKPLGPACPAKRHGEGNRCDRSFTDIWRGAQGMAFDVAL